MSLDYIRVGLHKARALENPGSTGPRLSLGRPGQVLKAGADNWSHLILEVSQ